MQELRTLRKVSLGLLALAWVALGVAFIGVLSTPRDYCGELATPSGELVTIVGLVVAGVALLAAGLLEAPQDYGLAQALVVATIAVGTVAAGVSVALFLGHQTSSWGCG